MPDPDQAEMTSYVRDICSECGNLRSICSDPGRPVYPQRSMCYVSAVKDLAIRRADKKYGEPDGATLHPTDGMHIWASPENLTPDDDFI